MAARDAGVALGPSEAMIVAGVGLTSKATTDDVVHAVRAACAAIGIGADDLRLLAGLDRPGKLEVLEATAGQLGLYVMRYSAERLAKEAGRCSTVSERSVAETGIPSVAEASALAAAGAGSALIAPRSIHGQVTVALAVSPEEEP